MNRIIKFRAWSQHMKIMVDRKSLAPAIVWDSEREPKIFQLFADDFILMQFTGLTDKNGKEIYEGDIVKSETDDEDSAAGNIITTISEVCYGQHPKAKLQCNYPASFTLYSTNFYDEHAIFYGRRWTHEVIGNIYENPELLKENI